MIFYQMWGRKSKEKFEEGGKESKMWEEYTPLIETYADSISQPYLIK